MKKIFIKNHKQQVIGVVDKWENQVDIPVIFNKKNIIVDGNKIGKRKWKSIMLEIENRDDLLEPNFHYPSYVMKDKFIRKVERSIFNRNGCSVNYNIPLDFSISLLSHNKEKIKYFSSINEIEDYISSNTEFKNKLDINDILVYYKGFELGCLTANRDKSWKRYSFKLSKVNSSNFELYYSYCDEDDSYINSQMLPDYTIYKFKHNPNIILITTYEYEDYGTYDFLIVDYKLLNTIEKLRNHIEDLLFN